MSSALSRNKLYLLLLFTCSLGWIWIYYNFAYNIGNYSTDINTCIIKQATGVPCPSCGTTRSIVSFLSGSIKDGLYSNPLGLIVLIIIMVSPVWVVFDFLFKKKSLYIFYGKVEMFFRIKLVAIIAIILVIANWIWNIQKGL